MKLSKYNRRIPLDNGDTLYYNSFQGGLLQLDMVQDKKLSEPDKLCERNKKLFEALNDGGYLVENDEKTLKTMKMNFHRARFQSNILGLTLAPTMDCNFACPYCFEKKGHTGYSEETEKNIIKFIEGYIKQPVKKISGLSVNWFGGEPLMRKKNIENLTGRMLEVCEREKISYEAGMITNGFLIDAAFIENMEKLKISQFQITIDGPEEIHNSRRNNKSRTLDSFRIIVENINKLAATKARVIIRINVDMQNKDSIDKLMEYFHELGWLKQEKILIDTALVGACTVHCAGMKDKVLTVEEFAAYKL